MTNGDHVAQGPPHQRRRRPQLRPARRGCPLNFGVRPGNEQPLVPVVPPDDERRRPVRPPNRADLAVPIRRADRVPANADVVTDRGAHRNLPLGWVFQYTILTPVGRRRQRRRLPSGRLGDPGDAKPRAPLGERTTRGRCVPWRETGGCVRPSPIFVSSPDGLVRAGQTIPHPAPDQSISGVLHTGRPLARRRQFRRADSAETLVHCRPTIGTPQVAAASIEALP
jgi:hypothetical protein